MKREQELVKNSILLSIGTVIPKVTSIITLPIVTGCLTTAEYGTYDLITVLVALLLPVATLQMQAAAFRFLMTVRDNPTGQKSTITNIFAFSVPVSIVVLAVFYFCLPSVDSTTRFLILGYYFIDILLATVKQVARGLGMNLAYSISAVINSVGEMILMAIFLMGLKEGLNGAVLSLGLSQLIALVFISIRTGIFRYLSPKLISAKTIKKMLAYSWPMVPNAMSSWVMRLSDRLVLTAVLGVEANAVYAVANKLPNIFSTLQNTVTLAWQENATMSVDDEDSGEYYGKIFDGIFNLMVGIMALLIAFTPVVFAILIRGDYDEAYNHMPILYLAVMFSAVSAYLGGIYIAHMKTKEIGITTTVAAVLNLAIDLLLVSRIGIYAATLSTLISYLVLAIYRMCDVQRFQKIHFRVKKIVLFIVILAVMSLVCFLRRTWLDLINMVCSIVLAVALNRDFVRGAYQMVRKKMKTGDRL